MSTAIRTMTLAAAPLLVFAACSSEPAGVQSTGAGESVAGHGGVAAAHEGVACAQGGTCGAGDSIGMKAGGTENAWGDEDAGPGGDGCADTGAPPDAGTDAGADAASDGGVPPQFTACQMDSDCMAVERVGCCRNGWMEAVNRNEADAYEASFVCPDRDPICPQYRILDTRSPECDNATHTCTMVPTDQIKCGGFIENQHHCPASYACDFTGHVPDIPGQCVPDTSAD